MGNGISEVLTDTHSFNTEQQLLYTHAKAQIQAHLTSLHCLYFWLITFRTVTVGLYTTIFFLTAFSSSIQMSGAACHVLQAPLTYIGPLSMNHLHAQYFTIYKFV